MGRKVEINYSKVKEISDLGLSIKETLERLHQCNINISRMQYYRWKQNNVTSSKEGNNVTSSKEGNNVTSSKECNNVTSPKKGDNVTSKHSSNVKNNVTSKDGNTTPTDDNVTLKGKYEVVGLGLKGRDELKGKRFDTLEEITSIGIPMVFIYDYNEGKCLTPTYKLEN